MIFSFKLKGFINEAYLFTEGEEELPRIQYADFQPRLLKKGATNAQPIFEPFSSLIAQVNGWILQHPEFVVLHMETSERECKRSGMVEPDKTVYHKPDKGYSDYISFIRYYHHHDYNCD